MADVARAEQFRALRAAHRKTQPEMAEVAGVTLRAYQAWESLKTPGGIEWEHAKAIAKHFKIDPETLVRRRDEDPELLDSQELRAQLDRIEQKLDRILSVAGLADEDADLNAAVAAVVRALEAHAGAGAAEVATGT